MCLFDTDGRKRPERFAEVEDLDVVEQHDSTRFRSIGLLLHSILGLLQNFAWCGILTNQAAILCDMACPRRSIRAFQTSGGKENKSWQDPANLRLIVATF